MVLLKKIKYYLLGNFVRSISSPFYQFEIDPKDACTIFGSRFSNGWNHIIETLKEYELNPNIDYKETTLYRFLKFFKVESLSDLTNDNVENKLDLFTFPWGNANKNLDTKKKNVLNSRFCAPSSDQFIKKEFDDIIMLYKKLKIEGYQPSKFPNSFIIGTWLIKSSKNSVFMILGGNHRMAVLCYLGLKKIKVRTHNSLIRKVKVKQINSWSLVKNNKCSKTHAKKVFDIFFDNNGKHLKKIIDKNYNNE